MAQYLEPAPRSFVSIDYLKALVYSLVRQPGRVRGKTFSEHVAKKYKYVLLGNIAADSPIDRRRQQRTLVPTEHLPGAELAVLFPNEPPSLDRRQGILGVRLRKSSHDDWAMFLPSDALRAFLRPERREVEAAAAAGDSQASQLLAKRTWRGSPVLLCWKLKELLTRSPAQTVPPLVVPSPSLDLVAASLVHLYVEVALSYTCELTALKASKEGPPSASNSCSSARPIPWS
jgi:hypothetical protein